MQHFYVGIHQLPLAQHFDLCFISANILQGRKSDFKVKRWIMDSGAFSEISTYGEYRSDVATYAKLIERWAQCPTLEAAVAQDYMCEPFILKRTGLAVKDHQRMTVERYDRLLQHNPPCYILPVIQGWLAHDYLRHLDQYGDRFKKGMYIGIGSVCKRNSTVQSVVSILSLVKNHRPDLRIHAFGLKTTALQNTNVRHLIHSADSMAWSFAARKAGRDANSWREAKSFEQKIQLLVDRPSSYTAPIWLVR
jgi:hypothetical protein